VAGRTDKGVHATEQVVSFSCDELDTDQVLWSLNRQLAPEIAARDLTRVPDDFHARYSATGRLSWEPTTLLRSAENKTEGQPNDWCSGPIGGEPRRSLSSRSEPTRSVTRWSDPSWGCVLRLAEAVSRLRPSRRSWRRGSVIDRRAQRRHKDWYLLLWPLTTNRSRDLPGFPRFPSELQHRCAQFRWSLPQRSDSIWTRSQLGAVS